jgi:hypothetical protein
MAILGQGFFELHGICRELLSWYALFENVPNYDKCYKELVLIIIDPITHRTCWGWHKFYTYLGSFAKKKSQQSILLNIHHHEGYQYNYYNRALQPYFYGGLDKCL